MIYFIACPAANAVKIGLTCKRDYLSADATAFARLSAAQVNCPLDLELVAICDGDDGDEIELHERFSHLRLRGEWFEFTDEIKGHIAPLHKPERQPRGWHSQDRNRSAAAHRNSRGPGRLDRNERRPWGLDQRTGSCLALKNDRGL